MNTLLSVQTNTFEALAEASGASSAEAAPARSEELHLISHGEYIRVLKPLLPPEAFKLSPGFKSAVIAVHTLLIASALWYSSTLESAWFLAFLGIVIGHSVSCLAFIGHEISHGSVYRSPRIRYAMEILTWAPILMPPTAWQRIHNHLHHVHANTPEDADRLFLVSEKGVFSEFYTKALLPHSSPFPGNPIVLFHFVVYTLRNVLVAFLSGTKKFDPPIPFAPYYGGKKLRKIAGELTVILAVQAGFYALTGFSLSAYLLCAVFPVFVSSGVLMMYIYTNHSTNPVTDESDPVLGSTSVVVPHWMDVLHSNFSHHTEHHLFPGLNSKYLPVVSALILEHFPGRYNRLPLAEAWRRIRRQAAYVEVRQVTQ